MSARGFSIDRGGEVEVGGRRFIITHVLGDLTAVIAQDTVTGQTEKLAVADLRAVTDGTESGPDAPDLTQIDDRDWDEASRRLEIIKPLLERNRTRRPDIAAAAQSYGVEASTVYRWIRQYRSTEKLSSLIPARSSGGRGKSRLPSNTDEIIGIAIEHVYLKPGEQRTFRATFEEVQRLCVKANVQPPHPNTVRNRISMISEQQRLTRRAHAKSARDLYEPAPGAFDDAKHPLSVVQIDHTLANVMLVDDEERLSIGRPWVTIAFDVYSRMVLGFVIGVEPPGANAAGRCMAHAILPKETWLAKREVDNSWPCWGYPARLHLDHAREFRGKMLRQACQQYGIEIDFRLLKKPESGGHIERYMGTLSSALRDLPGATFASPRERGEYDSEKHAVMTLPEFERWFAEYVTGVYHQEFHSGINMPPIKRWLDGISGAKNQPGIGPPLRPDDEDRLRLDFMPCEWRTVQRYGVEWDHLTYYSDVLRRYINAKEGRLKQKFLFRRDPRDISVIYFWDPQLNIYAEIPCADVRLGAVNIWEWRAVRNQVVKEGRRVNTDTLLSTRDRMQSQVEAAGKSTKKIRRARELRKGASRRERISLKPPEIDVSALELPADIKPFEFYDI